MNIIDVIKDFEGVGFNRKQAELQARYMTKTNDNLSTKDDIKALGHKIEGYIEIIGKKFDLIDARFETIEEKFDL
ncbi:MAG: hypothetical protein KDD37_03930, partial [Bdellovibrionales bacterium]|nr:hypothetical protein [Bdellovibrionales bacterium]